jgi:hypothetical protein
MSVANYLKFSEKAHLQFYCKLCCHDAAGVFNYKASLVRIDSCQPNLTAMVKQAESEDNLMSFYKVALPPMTPPQARGVRQHLPSVQLLEVS